MSLVATFDVETGAGTSGGDKNKNNKGVSGSHRRLRHSIYLGGKTDAKDYDKLVNRWKITHVLNCTPPKQTNIEAGVPNYFEKAQPPKRRLVYHRIPIYDAPASLPDLAEHEAGIVRFIAKGLCHGNVLVHCSRGVSRSTTSVVLYLMAKRDCSYEAALTMIRRRRPEAQPIPAFDQWLHERDIFYGNQRRQATANDSDTKKSKTGNGANPKKRKRAIGATAPSIGPAPPPPPNRPAIGPSIGPSIGPAPPPSSIGPELPPVTATTSSSSATAASIGPALPPSSATSPPKPSIGPALPPTSDTAQEPPKPSIGPELPP